MLNELSSVIKTVIAGEIAGTYLNAKCCQILSAYIKSLETQVPADLNAELEQALGAWEFANLEYHKVFEMPYEIAGWLGPVETAIERETQTRVRTLEVYRKIQKAAQDREHALNPFGALNE